MKLIPLKKFAEFSTVEIIKTVLENAPAGVNAGEIRKRMRVIDALEHAEKNVFPSVCLEDADHAVLAAAIESFPFTKATRDLLTAIDDVTNAKAPPEPVQPARSDAA